MKYFRAEFAPTTEVLDSGEEVIDQFTAHVKFTLALWNEKEKTSGLMVFPGPYVKTADNIEPTGMKFEEVKPDPKLRIMLHWLNAGLGSIELLSLVYRETPGEDGMLWIRVGEGDKRRNFLSPVVGNILTVFDAGMDNGLDIANYIARNF